MPYSHFKTVRFIALALATALAGTAHAQVDLSALDDSMAGPRAKVLVLGSVHLAELSEGVEPASLEPLLDRLEAFRPDVITIEAISGEGCDLMARHPAIYSPDAVSRVCRSPATAGAATGLDVPTAIAAVDATLADWPASPNSAQRRRLASLFLAANDMASAATQWLQLPQDERRAGDGMDDTLVAMLETRLSRSDEGVQIGAALAARLGHARGFPVDDHTGDAIDIDEGEIPAYGAAIQSAWNGARDRWQPFSGRREALTQDGDLLALYRYINRPDVLAMQIDTDQGAAMAGAAPPRHYGQLYVAGWETRNLRMVANVREAFRATPGARVLSIVGATHKPWFDSLLGQMQGVDIVDVETVLAP